jgi:hypothetical protein
MVDRARVTAGTDVGEPVPGNSTPMAPSGEDGSAVPSIVVPTQVAAWLL